MGIICVHLVKVNTFQIRQKNYNMKLPHNYKRYFAFLLFISTHVYADNSDSQDRNGKFLSMFEIVKFENDACTTGGNKNGTCFTSQECEDKGGKKDGDCAKGYGVCCLFEVNCGDSASFNNTYFTQGTGFSTGNCAVEFCPDEDICQIRLDFSTFAINGPHSPLTATTATDEATAVAHGSVTSDGTNKIDASLLWGTCNTDSFSVTSTSGTNPPVICGTNTGEHLYMDVSGGQCVTLAFSIGSGSASWNIQVQTYDSDFDNKAPTGCTQYYFGETTQGFKTFNYANGVHLANQNQRICFRQEKGKTKICYSTAATADFSVNVMSKSLNAVGYTNAGKEWCCGYGADGKQAYDCLQIPSAITENGNCVHTKKASGPPAVKSFCAEGAFCGEFGLAATNSKKAADTDYVKSICSKRVPFEVTFLSDGMETVGDDVDNYIEVTNKMTSLGTKGFQLYYIQS